MLKLWQTMVNIECGPGCKEGVDEIGSMLANFFTEIGGKNRIHKFADAGNMLVSGEVRILVRGTLAQMP